MFASRRIALAFVAMLSVAGCHEQGTQTAQQPAAAVALPMTPATERTRMHADSATAQAAFNSDAAAMQSASAPASTSSMPEMAATTGPTMIAVAHMSPSKSATTKPSNNNVSGTVTFTQMGDKVLVVADISGLEPNTRHGIHIHTRPDLSDPGLLSAGGHWNPDHHIHGGPTTSPVHAGDLGNLDADATGRAHLELTLSNVSVGGMKNDVIGHSVIIHAGADDLSSQPAGNSGPRVSGGVIELEAATKN